MSLSNDTDCTGFIICAILPLFALEENDHSCFPQVLRNLLSLAGKSSYFRCLDSKSQKECLVPIDLVLKNGDSIQTRSPCLLSSMDQLSRIRIATPRYMACEFDFARLSGRFTDHDLCVFVTRKIGHLPFELDDAGSYTIESRIFPPLFEEDVNVSHLSLPRSLYMFQQSSSLKTYRKKVLSRISADPILSQYCE
jgi:hypothetical protein